MSYTVYPYLVDLAHLQTIYGCQDTALVATLESKHADRMREEETPAMVWVKRPGEPLTQELQQPAMPTLRQAVRGIIAGTVPTVEDGWQYWYAFELLCDHFGTRLPNEHYEAIHGIGILEDIDGLQDLALYSRHPFPFPLPPTTDFPAVTYLTRDEVVATLARLLIVTLVAPYDWDGRKELDAHTHALWEQEWPKRLQLQYRGWLEDAMHTGRDVVAFL